MSELKGRDFVSLGDFSRKELLNILDTAQHLKENNQPGAQVDLLKGRTLAMIFERPSTRTRVSMESAMTQLGGHAQYLDIKTMHYGGSLQPGVASAMPAGGEPLTDTYRVLATYAEGIYHRTTYEAGSHKAMVEGASLVDVPVINACDDYEHPCQIMANLLTIREKKRKFEGLKLVYCGNAQECHSFLWSAPKLGMNLTIVLPERCDSIMDKKTLEEAKNTAKKTNSSVDCTHDLFEAAQKADVVYNSGGNNVFLNANPKLTIDDLEEKFTVNKEVMKCAKPDAIYMHSMPARRRPYFSWNDGGVTDEVIQGRQSVSVGLAENRMHSVKGILVSIIR
jgi:ornithine carbamoyltransferase